jgi:hypothetical protein
MSQFTDTLVQIARAEIGVRESPKNSNRGPRVDIYKAATWLPAEQAWPWCAAFICWTVREAMRSCGVKETATFKLPRTAGAWDFINWSLAQDETTKTARTVNRNLISAGDIIVFNFSHIGLATSGCGPGGNFSTIEGNTDASGSREGGGVYAKTHHISTVKARIRFTI